MYKNLILEQKLFLGRINVKDAYLKNGVLQNFELCGLSNLIKYLIIQSKVGHHAHRWVQNLWR